MNLHININLPRSDLAPLQVGLSSLVRFPLSLNKTMIRILHARNSALAALSCLLAFTAFTSEATAQQPHAHEHGPATSGKPLELGTSAAADREGRLWAVTKEVIDGDQFVVLQTSADMGKTWSPPRRIQQEPEPVAARGEERPKIAFGSKGEIYIAYTKPIAKPHIGEIRFVRSLDGGRTFSKPVTVHANRDVITHAFGSMIVDQAGRIYIAWIDGRGAEEAKARREPYSGSAIYYAVSADGGATFKGDYKVADHTCECCRIGLTLNPRGNPVAVWRHIFAPNIRDHALVELTPAGKLQPVTRVTFNDWRVDACPHHGPSVAYAPDGTRHQVWFNGKDGDDGGVLYAATAGTGKSDKPVSLGTGQASHADVAVQGLHVAIVWKQFDGKSTAINAKLSDDGGASWHEKELARTSADSDKPYLITSPSGVVLIWRTEKEGIRAIHTSKGSS
jgi:hypothetical protein